MDFTLYAPGPGFFTLSPLSVNGLAGKIVTLDLDKLDYFLYYPGGGVNVYSFTINAFSLVCFANVYPCLTLSIVFYL